MAWKMKEGDEVAAGDIYCEVETDKAMIDWEAQEEGFLAKILVGDGAKNIPIGQPVAIVVDDAADVAAFKDYTGGSSPSSSSPSSSSSSSAAAEATPPVSNSSGASFPAHEVFTFPALSPTMTAGNILKWHKNVGDEVAPGDVIAEVETDKASIEWEAQEEGVIAKFLVEAGNASVEVGAPVLVMVDDKESVAAFENFTAADAGGAPAIAEAAAVPPPTPKKAAAASAPKKAPKTTAAAAAAPPAGGRIIASPYAKKLAAQGNVSLSGVGGSGPNGRIIAADVEHLISTGGGTTESTTTTTTTATGGYTDTETTQIRRVIARRLLESKQQIPHYYLTVSCRIDRLTAIRATLNSTLAASPAGGKLSINDFVIKASALALRAVPEVNASWYGDFIRQYHTVDCSIAVQTPAGLMVPIVKNADRKGLAAIASEVRDLAGRAKDGKLAPEEFTGGTFTISNLGMFGVTQFAAIVNPPQACILAVGAAEKKVVPAASGAGFEEGTFMTVTLSCDHRVVDGAVGAQWLKSFKTFIEDPASMLL